MRADRQTDRQPASQPERRRLGATRMGTQTGRRATMRRNHYNQIELGGRGGDVDVDVDAHERTDGRANTTNERRTTNRLGETNTDRQQQVGGELGEPKPKTRARPGLARSLFPLRGSRLMSVSLLLCWPELGPSEPTARAYAKFDRRSRRSRPALLSFKPKLQLEH